MIQLSAFREKISWAVLLSILFYVGAAATALAVLLPAKKENTRLAGEIARLKRNETALLPIVEERPALERELAVIKAETENLLVGLPTQYDVLEALEVIRGAALTSDLEIRDLSHVPVKASSEALSGVVPLTLEVTGGERMFAFMAQITELLPSLQLTEAAVGYLGNGRFYASLRADLHVLMVEQAAKSRWCGGASITIKPLPQRPAGYGLPFQVVAEFLSARVKILGVINKGAEARALVAKDGAQSWVKVGDRLGEAVVNRIFSNGIVLDLDGVFLNLTIGG